MGEVRGLVTWEAFENQGKIAGSDWVCPTGRLDSLETVHMLGDESVEISDDELMILAHGRRQHLELLQAPEGFQAARIVDSQTGQELRDSRASSRYAGIVKCNCGQVHGAATTSVLSGRHLPLQDGKVLANVHNYQNGTQTSIKPSEDRLDSDYIPRLRTGLSITPQSHRLYIYTEGPIEAIPGAQVKMRVDEHDNTPPNMEFCLWLANDFDVMGQLNLELDSNGQPKSMKIYRRGLLDHLGITPEPGEFSFDQAGDWGVPQTKSAETDILNSMSEALGLGPTWTGFDLRATAAGLYTAIGRHNLDPASVLIANET